jgi:ribosomal protein S12 methylthiotransferase
MATQAPEIDGVTLINDFEGGEPRPGQMRRLRITEAHDYDLVGTLLAGGEEERGGDSHATLVQIGVGL